MKNILLLRIKWIDDVPKDLRKASSALRPFGTEIKITCWILLNDLINILVRKEILAI